MKLTGRRLDILVGIPVNKNTTATGGFWRATSSGETVDLRTLRLGFFFNRGRSQKNKKHANSYSHQSSVMFVIAALVFFVGVGGWGKQSHIKPYTGTFRLGSCTKVLQGRYLEFIYGDVSNTCSFCCTPKTNRIWDATSNIYMKFEAMDRG